MNKKLVIFTCISIFLISVLGFSQDTITQRRFYSKRYSLSIDLPHGFSVTQLKNEVIFKSNFSTTSLKLYLHVPFAIAFDNERRLGKGNMISQKSNVSFTYCRMLRATRGGYLLFKNKNMITHVMLLKKEYRVYVFKTMIKESDLPKLKSFIMAIKLKLPQEWIYEGTNNGKLYRLVISTDNAFSLSEIQGENLVSWVGTYIYKKNKVVLSPLYKIIKKNDFVKKLSLRTNTKIYLVKHGDDGKIRYKNIILKSSRF